MGLVQPSPSILRDMLVRHLSLVKIFFNCAGKPMKYCACLLKDCFIPQASPVATIINTDHCLDAVDSH